MTENRKIQIAPSPLAVEVAKNERERTRKEIVETRDRLGEFTLRDFSEGLFGEAYTKIIYGKQGGQIKMSELKLALSGSPEEGVIGMNLNQEQLIGIMMEAHPGLDSAGALKMLTSQPEESLRLANHHLAEHMDVVDDAAEAAHDAFRSQMLNEAKEDQKK